MALSNSFDISSTRTILCQAAMRKVGVLGEGQTATSSQTDIVVEALNFMIKAWQAEGMPVWQLKTFYMYPIHDDSDILIGPSGGNVSEELGLTKLTAAAASGATAITVATTSAVDVVGTSANSDNIGIEQDDGTILWTTISAGGGTASITLAAGLTEPAITGARVFYYTTKAQRPTEIEGAWRVEVSSGDKIEIEPTGLKEIIGQVHPTEEGPPIVYNYQATLTDGTFRIWPRFQNGSSYLELLAQHPFDDIDAASNNPAFPQEWYEALVYGLAVRIAPEFGLPLQERMVLKEEAQAIKDRAFMAARENASIIFTPTEDWSNG